MNPVEPGAFNPEIDNRAVATNRLLEGVDPGDLGFDCGQPADHRSQPFLECRQLMFRMAVCQLTIRKPLDNERMIVPNLLEIEQPRLEIACEPLDSSRNGGVETEHTPARLRGRKNTPFASTPLLWG